MAKLGDLVVRIGADTRGLNRSLGKVQRNMRSMTSNFTKLGTSMSKALTLPLAAVGGASLKLAVDFQSSMAQVKAVTGATAGDFKSLEETAKKLGSTTVFTAKEVAGLMLEYGKLGFSTKQIEDAAEATLLLAQATGSDLVQAAEVAGSTLGGFGLAATETGRLADVMAAAFTGSALDINKFQDSMKFVAPVAKAAGVSLEEASAMLGVMADSGIKGSQAGTALRRILQELSGESGTVTEKLAKLSAKGLGVKDAFDEVGRNASSALLVLSEGVTDVASFTTELENSGGAAKDMADIMNDTAAGSLKRMTSALEGAALVIGDALAPTMESLANFVADLAVLFRQLEPGTQKIVVLFGALLASLGPILLILPQILAALPLIAGAFAAMTGPIGLAVLGVTALIAAIAALVSANKDIPSTLERANAAVREHSTEVRYLVGQYKDETKSLEDRKKILSRLADIDATHFGNLQAESTTYNDLVTNLDAYTASLRKNYLEKSFAEQGTALFGGLADDEAAINQKRSTLQKAIDIEAAAGRWTREAAKRNRIQIEGELEDLQEQRDQTLINIEAFEQEKQRLLEKYATTDAPGATTDETGAATAPVVVVPVPDTSPLKEAVDDITGFLFELQGMGTTAFATLSNGIQDFVVSSTPQLLSFLNDFGVAVENTAEVVAKSVRTMADDINDAISSGVADMISGVSEMVGTAIGAQKPIENMGAFLGNTLGDMAINLGKYAIAHGTVIEAIKKSMTDLGGVKAIVAGLALIALGAGIKGAIARSAESAGVPALAEGGLAYGPTLAMVGDNKGANIDPEVVAPLSKLKGMLGGNTVQVYGRISGDDIVISNSRASRDRNRF